MAVTRGRRLTEQVDECRPPWRRSDYVPRCRAVCADARGRKFQLRLCQNCVTYPRNPRHTPRFTGTRRCTSLLREVVDRKCGGIRCGSARV